MRVLEKHNKKNKCGCSMCGCIHVQGGKSQEEENDTEGRKISYYFHIVKREFAGRHTDTIQFENIYNILILLHESFHHIFNISTVENVLFLI